jgi:hypothetical protein
VRSMPARRLRCSLRRRLESYSRIFLGGGGTVVLDGGGSGVGQWGKRCDGGDVAERMRRLPEGSEWERLGLAVYGPYREGLVFVFRFPRWTIFCLFNSRGRTLSPRKRQGPIQRLMVDPLYGPVPANCWTL